MNMSPGFLNEATLAAIAQKHNVLQESVKGRGTEIATLVFQNAEVFAGAFGAGWANGRFASVGKDHAAIGGIPIDLTIGVVGSLAAALDAFGPMNTHVAHLAMGVGSGYFYRLGMGQGAVAREAKMAPPSAAPATSPVSAPSPALVSQPVAPVSVSTSSGNEAPEKPAIRVAGVSEKNSSVPAWAR